MKHKHHIEHSAKWRQWKSSAEGNGLQINKATCLNWVPGIKNDDFLFGFFEVSAQSKEGLPFPKNILIRGDAVVILPVIKDPVTRNLYTVLVSQLRSATGGNLLELPAGMIDSPSDNPRKKAYAELIEETDMTFFKEEDITPFPLPPVYTSPGLLDEKIYYYYAQTSLSESSLKQWENKMTGCHHENEHIRLKIVPFKEAFEHSLSIPALFALYWYETHRLHLFQDHD